MSRRRRRRRRCRARFIKKVNVVVSQVVQNIFLDEGIAVTLNIDVESCTFEIIIPEADMNNAKVQKICGILDAIDWLPKCVFTMGGGDEPVQEFDSETNIQTGSPYADDEEIAGAGGGDGRVEANNGALLYRWDNFGGAYLQTKASEGVNGRGLCAGDIDGNGEVDFRFGLQQADNPSQFPVDIDEFDGRFDIKLNSPSGEDLEIEIDLAAMMNYGQVMSLQGSYGNNWQLSYFDGVSLQTQDLGVLSESYLRFAFNADNNGTVEIEYGAPANATDPTDMSGLTSLTALGTPQPGNLLRTADVQTSNASGNTDDAVCFDNVLFGGAGNA